MSSIRELKPKELWGYFDDITKVPRPSKKEAKILEYLKRFSQENNLRYKQDDIGNIVIYKDASAEYNGNATVILQSHVDMVCEKNNDVDFDFDNAPIQTVIEDGWVKAKGTTLGADCGIGMATQMAILTSNDIIHPNIEALFTVEEETGLTGAFNIGKDMLSGEYLINLDSEDEGMAFIGCAGGIDTIAEFRYKAETIPSESAIINIEVSGLNGGHSGDDINKCLANANIILMRFLFDHFSNGNIRLISFDGGNLRNAIPREAVAVIAVEKKKADLIISDFKKYSDIIKHEFHNTEKGIQMLASPCYDKYDGCIDRNSAKGIINAACCIPNGVVTMSQDIANFVETSTNLASIKMRNGIVTITTSQRSSLESKKYYLSRIMRRIFETYGAIVIQSDGYPGWTPAPESNLVLIFEEQYKKIFGKELIITAIHAGLECGLFLEKYPSLKMISVGPTLRNVHSPSEKIEIESVNKFWILLQNVLPKIG